MLIGDQAAANTNPYIRSQQPDASIEHEASTCRISADQLFYLQSRGIAFEEAVSMMVSGFCRDVFNQLPMEFAAEADKLLALKLGRLTSGRTPRRRLLPPPPLRSLPRPSLPRRDPPRRPRTARDP
jgi:hypothetical protein